MYERAFQSEIIRKDGRREVLTFQESQKNKLDLRSSEDIDLLIHSIGIPIKFIRTQMVVDRKMN